MHVDGRIERGRVCVILQHSMQTTLGAFAAAKLTETFYYSVSQRHLASKPRLAPCKLSLPLPYLRPLAQGALLLRGAHTESWRSVVEILFART